MRQQYHSRIINGDRLIWNVNKLVEAATGLPVRDVPLDDIQELDETFWYDEGGAPPTCRSVCIHVKLIQETDLQYPIILCPQGRVIDGMHRVCKALIAGHSTLKAIQLPAMPAPDYTNVALDDLPYDSPPVTLP
jgi:hypothetical protein